MSVASGRSVNEGLARERGTGGFRRVSTRGAWKPLGLCKRTRRLSMKAYTTRCDLTAAVGEKARAGEGGILILTKTPTLSPGRHGMILDDGCLQQKMGLMSFTCCSAPVKEGTEHQLALACWNQFADWETHAVLLWWKRSREGPVV